jgi:transcriptional regulator with XRE-family HTH domain
VKYYRDDKVLKKLGKRIREVRKSKNISQENLAFDCGLEYSQINRIELGKVNTSISHLFLIARVLKVSPQELLDF